jgi:hypothetical protein
MSGRLFFSSVFLSCKFLQVNFVSGLLLIIDRFIDEGLKAVDRKLFVKRINGAVKKAKTA